MVPNPLHPANQGQEEEEDNCCCIFSIIMCVLIVLAGCFLIYWFVLRKPGDSKKGGSGETVDSGNKTPGQQTPVGTATVPAGPFTWQWNDNGKWKNYGGNTWPKLEAAYKAFFANKQTQNVTIEPRKDYKYQVEISTSGMKQYALKFNKANGAHSSERDSTRPPREVRRAEFQSDKPHKVNVNIPSHKPTLKTNAGTKGTWQYNDDKDGQWKAYNPACQKRLTAQKSGGNNAPFYMRLDGQIVGKPTDADHADYVIFQIDLNQMKSKSTNGSGKSWEIRQL